MQIENIIKDILPPPPQPPPPPPPPPTLTISQEDLITCGPNETTFPSQLLQLKWQLFCVQKSQQELASAILQLSSLILANSAPQNPLTFPHLPPPTQPPPPPVLGFQPNRPPTKRRWSSKEVNGSSPKYSMLSPNQPKVKQPEVALPCRCDVCQKSEGAEDRAPDVGTGQTPLDLYVAYFLNSLENKHLLLPPPPPPPPPPPLPPVSLTTTISEPRTSRPNGRLLAQPQDKPLDLATHSRTRMPKIEITDSLARPRPTCSQPAMPEYASEMTTSPNSLNLSPSLDSSPLFPFQKSHSDGKRDHAPVVDDILQLEAASTNSIKPSWSQSGILVEKDKAVVILNPSDPREMFVGGDPKVRLPVWAYKKCVYMVGREQKRPAARLCLCLLQSLFSLRYLVSHNYSGSRQKRPIDPMVMKAVLKQAMMQFGRGDNVFPGSEFSQGKLRDYLNNAFRVMAFRRRRGDRVKSPFWNDAGDPILSLDPPKDFRLNDIILTKVLPSFR
ncbi:unnamed protein product [Mesocestoides corti]|uniref:DUF5725 domain-containing protein n=2 Tax=Mesocestoides corti TaxID=53468 RepID=A0A0R3U8L0_MESCO|nr:unnamed protein product [Mesocestoides corti]